TMTIDEFIDPLTFLKKIASLFDLEIQYRVEVVGSQIVGWYVDMVKKRGRDTGKEVTLGKDLVGVRRIEHSRDICTTLVGFVRGEGDTIITVESINNGLPYLVDNDAFQRWNERGQHKFGFYTPETEQQNMTPQRLMTLMKTELAKRVNTSVTYDVEAVAIGRVFGLAHELINEGDTIRIKDTGFTPNLYLEARVIAGDESFTDPLQDKYVFGDYREIVDPNEELRKLYNRVLASLGNKANKERLEQLEKLAEEAKGTAEQAQKESQAAKELAEKVQENLRNNTVEIIEAVNPPTTNLKIGKTIWRDISNGKPGILKVWNGKDWELLIPDVEGIKKDTLEQVTKEINASAEKLDARVKEAETKADNLQKDFNAVKGEQERVSQVTKTLEESDEATKEIITRIQGTQEDMNKTIVETTKGVEGLQSTVSDIKKDQNGITDRVVKTEQNINGMSSSIEQINKTSSQTIQKLNKVEEGANGTKQTIERIEKNVNNLDGDVINLVRGTKTLTTNEELSLKGGRLSVIKDTYNGNAIAQTDTEWQGIAVKPSELIKRGKIKIGDTVTFSVTARMIGGESTQVFFPNSAGRTTVNGEWKRVSVTIPVGSDAIDPNVVYRFEAESIPKGALYQQTSPMLSITKKNYPWRPSPEDQADSNEFIKVTTEIKTEAGRTKERMEQINTKVENIDVGVSNLVINSSCDNEKPRMFDQPGESQVGGVDDIRYYEKHLAIKCNRHTDAFYQIGGYEKSLRGLEPGKEVTISADINCESVDYHFEMFYATNAEGNNWRAFVGEIYKELKIWKRRSFTFKIPNDTTSIMFRIYFGRVETSNGTWLNFKNVQIEKGNVATGYKRSDKDQVTNTEFTKKTTDIEKSVDGIKENITMVEQNQTGFDKRVTAVEKNAESISQNVSKLQETQTTQGKQISEAQSTIKQHSDALNLAVKMKDVEDYVGGIGNQTVLRNVLWKNDTKYWQLTSNAARDTQVTYKGCNSLSVITTGNASNLYKGASHDYINAGPGWNYVFSAYFYTDNKASIDAGAAIEIQCYDANNKMIKNYLQEITIAQGTWIRTHVAGLLVEGTKKVKVLFWVRKNGRLWMAQPMLQIGDKPSSFMENPVDIVDKDKIMEEVADKIATEDYTKKVTELERSIAANEEGVSIISGKQETFINETYNAYVKKTESKLQVLDQGILAQVKKGDIIAALNMSAEEIKIDVSKLSINADTVVKWLTAQGIDANVIKISGDVVTIDKSGITVRMANFLYQDEFGKKYSVMPKKNLIADHMFSSISCYLPTNNMRKIQHSPEWRITGEPYIEDNYTDFGYEQMINAMRINVQHWIRYPLFSGVKRSKKYTLSAHFRAATYNGNVVSDYPRLRVITGHYAPDGRPIEDLRFEKAYDAPGRNIVRYSNTFTIPDNFPDNGFCYFDIYGAGDYGSNMAVCVSGVQLVEGDLPAVYNWDTTIDNIASGYTPVQSLSIGNRDTFLGYGVTSPEFRISTNADVHFNRKISTYGVNVGGQPFGAYGSIFYANGASGWSFYTMGIDGNWKTWNGI
ncbi:phage tail spike protein, partial [Bacillus cereus]